MRAPDHLPATAGDSRPGPSGEISNAATDRDVLVEVIGERVLTDPVFAHPFPTDPLPSPTGATGGTAVAPHPAADHPAAENPAADDSAGPGGLVGRHLREWVVGFLIGQRSPHTRRAYAADLRDFLGWCVRRGVSPWTASRGHVDAYARELEATPRAATGRLPAAATVARRLACVAGFYRYAVLAGWVAHSPADHVARPRAASALAPDPELPPRTAPLGPSRTQMTALLAAAEAHSPRAHALVALLVHTGLRIGEALAADVTDWHVHDGHEVLDVVRKGAAPGYTVLTAPVVRALRTHLGGRSSGPLFPTSTGGRLDQPAAWRLLQHLARHAELSPGGLSPNADDRAVHADTTDTASGAGAAAPTQPETGPTGRSRIRGIHPHALRHGFVTAALDAGAALRDVQDAAGHASPTTTRAYDRARGALDRHAAYDVTRHLAAT